MYRECSFVLLSLFIISKGDSPTPSPFDRLVDEVLYEFTQNESTIKIPDINIQLSKKVLFWTVHGDLKTTGGEISNTTTIKRMGDVQVEENNDLSIAATFGMSDLALHFDDISLDFLFFHIKDGINLKIDKNAVNFNVSFHYDQDGQCSVILNNVEVTSLGSFHTELLPENFLHTILDYLITATLDMFESIIKNVLNGHLTQQLSQVLQTLDLCSKLPF